MYFLCLLLILSESADDRLLWQIFIQHHRNLLCFQIVLILLADNSQSDTLYQFCRFHISWATLYACEACQAIPYGFGLHQRFDVTFLNHVYKLVWMVLHLVKRRTSCGTFSAFHAFSGIHTTDMLDGLSVNSCVQAHDLRLLYAQGFGQKLCKINDRQLCFSIDFQIIPAKWTGCDHAVRFFTCR